MPAPYTDTHDPMLRSPKRETKLDPLQLINNRLRDIERKVILCFTSSSAWHLKSFKLEKINDRASRLAYSAYTSSYENVLSN